MSIKVLDVATRTLSGEPDHDFILNSHPVMMVGGTKTFLDLDTTGSTASCERMSFNPWNALPDHRPLGDFNRARREIYRAMAAFRLERRP